MTDKQTAETYIKLCADYEQSWNGTEYTMARTIGLVLRPAMDNIGTPFAMVLSGFCVSWTEDCKSICEEVIKNHK